MSKEFECPYCGADVEINHDDGYEEDQVHEQECRECEKVFAFTTAISFHHRAHKADCLNGGKHQYEKTVTYPPEFARMRCAACGHEMALPANVELTGGPDKNLTEDMKP